MRLILILFLAAWSAFAADTIHAFGYSWKLPVAGDWKVESPDGVETLLLTVPRPSTAPRRPSQYALAETADFSRVTVEAEMKKEPAAARDRHTSLMIVYGWQDENHFDYAHLSVDTGVEQPVHNGIFRVDGGDRVRISQAEGPAALTSEDWHQVRLEWDGAAGLVEVFVNGKKMPSLTVKNVKYTRGKVGIGSFFDWGSFRRVTITGTPAR